MEKEQDKLAEKAKGLEMKETLGQDMKASMAELYLMLTEFDKTLSKGDIN